MNVTLMHRKLPVAGLSLDSATAAILKIRTVYAPAHLPIGVLSQKGTPDRAKLNEWWLNRSIPTSRSGLREALRTLGVASPSSLLPHSYGLSLSDQYWVCSEESGLKWEDINFFDHPFSNDVGDILFGLQKGEGNPNLVSPDNTSDGNLKKRWKIVDGKRVLLKGGSPPFHQQPFNEVIAAGIMERLGIDHVPYAVVWDRGEPYSTCPDFVGRETELVSAWRIMLTRKKRNDVSLCQHFLDCCSSLGIEGAVPFLDRMIALDFILANEDRHFGNFGVLRDAKTLEWLGFAPVYDSGSSLGYDKTAAGIRMGKGIICKPFKNSHTVQLGLISDLSWFRPDALSDAGSLIRAVLTQKSAEEYIDAERAEAICFSVRRRIQMLTDFIPQKQRDAASDDVAQNEAAAY